MLFLTTAVDATCAAKARNVPDYQTDSCKNVLSSNISQHHQHLPPVAPHRPWPSQGVWYTTQPA